MSLFLFLVVVATLVLEVRCISPAYSRVPTLHSCLFVLASDAFVPPLLLGDKFSSDFPWASEGFPEGVPRFHAGRVERIGWCATPTSSLRCWFAR